MTVLQRPQLLHFPSLLQLVGGDPDKDIAVLQLECETSKMEETKPIRLGQSSNLLVGQKVYAIGNPFGLDHTLTQGIVSGVGRELNTPGMCLLQTLSCLFSKLFNIFRCYLHHSFCTLFFPSMPCVLNDSKGKELNHQVFPSSSKVVSVLCACP